MTAEKPVTSVNRQSGQNKGNSSCPYPRTEMYLLITASIRREGKKRRTDARKSGVRKVKKKKKLYVTDHKENERERNNSTSFSKRRR